MTTTTKLDQKNLPALNLSGMIPPVISPLSVNRTADRGAIARVAQHVLAGSANGVFVLGTSGEGATLTESVASAVLKGYIEEVNGRVPVLAGVAGTSIERNLELAARWIDLGADALVVMTPMYFNTSGDEPFIRNVEAIAEVTNVPIVVYNIPHLTHHAISPEALSRVASIGNVVAIKESSGVWETFEPLMRAAHRNGLQVLQGAEKLIAKSLAEGADGAVPGIANVAPAMLSRLVQAGLSEDHERARDIQEQVNLLATVQEFGFWLSALKEAVAHAGVARVFSGAALPAVTHEQASRIAEIVGEFAHEITNLEVNS